MELGCDFDDDLFGETKEINARSKIPPFEPQEQNYMWFANSAQNDKSEYMTSVKLWGDWAYRNNNYETALEKYQACQDLLPYNSGPLYRELNDSVARCYTHLCDKDHALQMCQKAVSGANNIDQVTQALKLKSFVYTQFDMYEENISCVEQLCIIQSGEPDLWFQLYLLYSKTENVQMHLCTGVCCILKQGGRGDDLCESNNDEGVKTFCMDCLHLKQLTCLYRSQLLLKIMYKNVFSFAKDKNRENKKQVEAALAKFNTIPESVRKKCLQHVSEQTFKNEEDVTTVGEKYLLSLLEDYHKVFTEKWYSWTLQSISSDIT